MAIVTAFMLALASASSSDQPPAAVTLASDPSGYVQCAWPYLQTLNACINLQDGGVGEQFIWRPEFGPSYTLTSSASGFVIRAYRMTDAARAAILHSGIPGSTADLNALAIAKWTVGRMESRAALPATGYSFSQTFLPGAGVSAWSGPYLYGADKPYRAKRPEIDDGEVTNDADGSMLVRQQMHGNDPVTGKWSTWPAAGCPARFPKLQWVNVGHRIVGNRLTWTLNGKDTCSIDIPAGLAVPMHLRDVLMVGWPKPTDAATPSPLSATFAWPKVTALP